MSRRVLSMAWSDANATLLSQRTFPSTIRSSVLCRTLHACVSSRALSRADFYRRRIRHQPHSFSPSSPPQQPALNRGGDFIGLSATIDHRNGALIPVHEYLVPKKLLRWGQAPTCLQLLVSEDDDPANYNAAAAYWSRQTLTVFPETDCGIENLRTMQSDENVEWSNVLSSMDSSVRVLIQTVVNNHDQPRQMTVECAFGWFDEHRVRMVANVNMISSEPNVSSARTTTFHIQTPVQIVLERQISAKRGTVAGEAAGGLDSQQLSIWMGHILTKNSSFAEHGSPGVWNAPANSGDPFHGVPILILPGNLTISSWHSGELWIVEMGHIFPQERLRTVATIKFRSPSACEMVTRVEDGEFIPKVK